MIVGLHGLQEGSVREGEKKNNVRNLCCYLLSPVYAALMHFVEVTLTPNFPALEASLLPLQVHPAKF